jgi:adenine-specific DNA-methyltransferase
MIYNTKDPSLFKYKKELIERKIKKFDENNWYMWGRGYCESKKNRIYVNGKTRQKNPFF